MAYQQQPPLPSSDLAYPWLSQWDPNHSAEYYVNAETGESTWSKPAQSQAYQDRGFDPSATSSAYDYSSQPGSSYSSGEAPPSRAVGEAASFYGNSQPSYARSSQNNAGMSGQGGSPNTGEPGERGLGTVIVAGGALWMAHKLWKDWQKNKLSSQQQSQLRPPTYAPAQQMQQHQQHQSSQYGQQGQGQYRASQAFNPQQVYGQAPPVPPQQAYGAYQQQPPPSYGNAYNSSQPAYQGQAKGFDEPIPQPSFNGAPIDAAYPSQSYGGGATYASDQYQNQSQAQYPYQQQQVTYPYSGQQQHSTAGSGWSDPRY